MMCRKQFITKELAFVALCLYLFLGHSSSLSAQWVPSLGLMDHLLPDTIWVVCRWRTAQRDIKPFDGYLYIRVDDLIDERGHLFQPCQVHPDLPESFRVSAGTPIRIILCQDQAYRDTLYSIFGRPYKGKTRLAEPDEVCDCKGEAPEQICGTLPVEDLIKAKNPRIITLAQFARLLYPCGMADSPFIKKRHFYVIPARGTFAYKYCRYVRLYRDWPMRDRD